MKKKKNYIIPHNYFYQFTTIEKVDISQQNNKKKTEESPYIQFEKSPIEINKEDEKLLGISEQRKGLETPSQTKSVSSLSISSIALKKEAEQRKNIPNNPDEVVKNNFTEEDLQKHWHNFTQMKIKEGSQNIASILALKKPLLNNNFVVSYQVANALNQVELEEALPEILDYLRVKLNNFVMKIELSISEQIREETVYTAQEKYDFLLKINPELKNLKETFDLDF